MVNYKFLIPMLVVLVATQVFAVFLSIPAKANDVSAFGDPESVGNPFIYVGMVLLVTAFILLLYKFGFRKFLTVFFLISVWASIAFVVIQIVQQYHMEESLWAVIALTAIPLIAVLLMWKYPEWYVIDIIGFVMCVSVTAIIGVSFGIVPVIILIIIFAIYDAISVYKTKHMVSLAETVLDQRLPALFIIPKTNNFSYIKSESWKGLDKAEDRQAYILGFGDIIIPSSVVVSASAFIAGGIRVLGVLSIPAVGAMIGSCIGLIALHWYTTKHPQAHAGLPFLNTATLIGFLIAYAATAV